MTGAPLEVLAGILDTLGNVLFMFAAHSGRLDIAAILSSLYPAVTVGLSVLVLRVRVTGIQTVGVLLVLPAIPVISAEAISSSTLWTPLAGQSLEKATFCSVRLAQPLRNPTLVSIS